MMEHIFPRILVWNEYRHEKQHTALTVVYPDGIHGAVAGLLCAVCYRTRYGAVGLKH